MEVIDHTDTQAAVYNVRPNPKQITLLDHPLLTLLASVNPVHNAFDLWELTKVSNRATGSC